MAYEIIKGSAEFKYGMSDIDQLSNWLQDNPSLIGLSFVGRSNVGKSSLINTLFGKSTARVSKTPGRTREINIFTFKVSKDGKEDKSLPTLFLFDLPGYGHAKVSKEMSEHWGKLMQMFFKNVTENVCMINLQDSRHPNQTSDQEFQEFLRGYDFETVLAFNKLDKLKKQKERAALNSIKPKLFKEFKWVKQIHFISAEKKSGIPQLHEALINFLLHRVEVNK